MTNQQFDYLLSLVIKQTKLITILTDKIEALTAEISSLNEKTVVVSDIDEQVKQLEIDIKSLIDEQEA